MLASSSVPVTTPPGFRNSVSIFLSASSSRFWRRTDNLIPSSKSRIDSSRFVSPDSSFATTFSRLFRASSKVGSFAFAGMLPSKTTFHYISCTGERSTGRRGKQQRGVDPASRGPDAEVEVGSRSPSARAYRAGGGGGGAPGL